MNIKRKIFIGSSGWMYKDWGKRFYPKDLKEDHLTYLSKEFKTVEINSSFYRMPNEKTFEQWRKKSNQKFIFSVKLNRYITHRKRLIMDEESKNYLQAFLKNTQKLEKKLEVILIQLPPSFKKNSERLNDFLIFYVGLIKALKYKSLSAIEFRHDSWFDNETYALLKKYKIGFVISSTPEFRREIFTSSFCYIRMHGGEEHKCNYLKKDLDKLKKEIDSFPSEIKKVFVYFNNDYSAFAIDNARYLADLFESAGK